MEAGIVVLAGIGLLVLLLMALLTLYHTVRGVRAHLTLSTVPFTTRFGSWAVITGSTDGIGRAYAFQLAKRGVNIVLISRSQEKLDRVAEELRKTFLIQTKTIAVDFSQGSEAFEKLETELRNMKVGILVNNVGKQYEYPMFLAEVPKKDLWDIININVGATTQMTRLVLPGMVERGKGAIVNVSSGSEAQPLPLMTVYAATKTFIKSFSTALRCEYGKQGITIQHLSPLFVTTKMNNFSDRLQQKSLMVPDAETYAAAAVNTLGRLDQSAGCLSHGFQSFFIDLSPAFLSTYIGWTFNVILRNDYFSKNKFKD